MPRRLGLRVFVLALLPLASAGCRETKHDQCNQARAAVSEEMKATAAFGTSATSGRPSYATYAVALRKASADVARNQTKDPALRHALDTYVDATSKLAGTYDIQADGGILDASVGVASVQIIYGSLLDQSRIAIANACPN